LSAVPFLPLNTIKHEFFILNSQLKKLISKILYFAYTQTNLVHFLFHTIAGDHPAWRSTISPKHNSIIYLISYINISIIIDENTSRIAWRIQSCTSYSISLSCYRRPVCIVSKIGNVKCIGLVHSKIKRSRKLVWRNA
jgi:hypothetical protein